MNPIRRIFRCPDSRRALLFFAVAALSLAGCASLFGEADTLGQTAWRATAKYVYAAIPAEAYTKAPDAQAGVVAALCVADETAFAATRIVATARGAGAGVQEVSEAAATVGQFSYDVLGTVELPDDAAEAAGRALVLGAVAAQTLPRMHAWRSDVMRPALDAMVGAGRDPSAGEWELVEAESARLHESIQSACPGAGVVAAPE